MVTDDSDDEWLRELLQWDDDSMMSSAGESTTTAETPNVAISTPSSPTQVSRDASIMRPQLIRLQTRRASGRLASTNYWKTYVPKSLHNMAGLASAVNDILAHPAIHLRVLADAVLGSKLLAHAHEVIGILAAEKQFKIGLTRSPLHRWENPAYGYELEGRWCSMVVFAYFSTGSRQVSSYTETLAVVLFSAENRVHLEPKSKLNAGQNRHTVLIRSPVPNVVI